MKEISLQNFLVKYGLLYIVLSQLIVIILNIFGMGALIIYLIIVPIASSKLSSIIISKNKKIVDRGKKIKKNFLLTNVIVGIISYMLLFYFDILIFSIYMICVLVGYKISVKSIEEKISENNSEVVNEEKQNVTEMNNTNNIYETKNENIIENYDLNKFDDENIVDFLSRNNLNYENYFFASDMPGFGTYALYGAAGAMTMTNYIVTFDNSKIYLFELSKTSNKKIINLIKINLNDVEYLQSKNAMFGIVKRIKLKLKNGDKYNFQCNKKVHGIEKQLLSLEKFINIV